LTEEPKGEGEIAIKWWRSSKRASAAGAPPPEPGRTPEDEQLLERLAVQVVRHRMTVPAILFLESMKPLSFVGSQALYFFEPMVRALFAVPEYERFAALLERRDTMEALLVKIEARDDEERRAERQRREERRAARDAERKGKGHS